MRTRDTEKKKGTETNEHKYRAWKNDFEITKFISGVMICHSDLWTVMPARSCRYSSVSLLVTTSETRRRGDADEESVPACCTVVNQEPQRLVLFPGD